MRRRQILALPSLLAAPLAAPALAPAWAQERTINLYSARHYDSDRSLWDSFTRQTNIRVRVVEANIDQLMERLRAEGANSPADVLVTVDIARLVRATELGIFEPIRNAALESRIPAHLRDADGHWFGFTTRARVLMYDKALGLPAGLARYEDLAKPEFANSIAVRSSNHVYNVNLAASIVAADGAAATEAWARGVANNLARPPAGGDRDQIRAVLAGQGRIAVSNSYYLGLMAISEREEDKQLAARVGVLFPNQGDRGTHVNVSGAGMVKTAPNKEAARAFLEFLSTPEAQSQFAMGNMEFPAVTGAAVHPFLAALGSFKQDPVDPRVLASHMPEALRIMQRAGWR